jgi:hypothetical protein
MQGMERFMTDVHGISDSYVKWLYDTLKICNLLYALSTSLLISGIIISNYFFYGFGTFGLLLYN